MQSAGVFHVHLQDAMPASRRDTQISGFRWRGEDTAPYGGNAQRLSKIIIDAKGCQAGGRRRRLVLISVCSIIEHTLVRKTKM
jgi:hypothetical protein